MARTNAVNLSESMVLKCWETHLNTPHPFPYISLPIPRSMKMVLFSLRLSSHSLCIALHDQADHEAYVGLEVPNVTDSALTRV